MGLFSKSVHDAVYDGDEKYIREFIKKKGELNQFNSSNSTPLLAACSSSHYKIAILLLEAGATPHYHPEGVRCLPPIHLMITYAKIRAMKLLLWFDPNYENVLDALDKTVNQRIADWPQSVKNLLQTTAEDSKKVIACRRAAETAEQRSDYLEAALQNATIAEIFYCHSQLEKAQKFMLSIPWPDYTREQAKQDDQKAQQIFTEYYLIKAEEYFSRFIECLKQLPKPEDEKIKAFKDRYQKVLNELIEIYKGDLERKKPYLYKLAYLLVKPDSTSEHTSSSEDETISNDETQPLLGDALGNFGLHKRHPVLEKVNSFHQKNTHQFNLSM